MQLPQVIDDILDISKTEAVKTKVHWENIVFFEVITKSISMLRQRAEG